MEDNKQNLDEVECPFCAEKIKSKAIKCRHCGEMIVSKSASEVPSPAKTIDKETLSLWNPNAAANWSLLFSPIFSAILHSKNWAALGHEDKAKKSMLWIYPSLISITLTAFMPSVSTYTWVFNFFYLFTWYFASARPQAKYVKSELNDVYKRKGWFQPILIAIIVFAVYIGATYTINSGHQVSNFLNELVKTELPECDSEQAKDTMKSAIENGAYSNIAKVQLLDTSNLAEVSFDKKEDIRTCIGDVVLNTGNEAIVYTLSWAKGDSSKFLIQLQPVDTATAAAMRQEALEHSKGGGQNTQQVTQETPHEPTGKQNINLPSLDWNRYQSMTSDQVLSDAQIANYIKPLLKEDYDKLYNSMQVVSKVETTGSFLVGNGCVAHMCNTDGGFFAINMTNGQFFSALKEDGQERVLSGSLGDLPTDVATTYNNW